MKKTEVKVLDQGTWGKVINLPIAGEVNVSLEGTVEVDEEVSEMLLEHPSMFSGIGKAGSKSEKKTKVVETDEEKEEVEEKVKEGEEDIKEALSMKSLKFLKGVINSVEGLKDKQKEKYSKNKEVAVDFLVENFSVEELKELLA